jgi:hypothetical protein
MWSGDAGGDDFASLRTKARAAAESALYDALRGVIVQRWTMFAGFVRVLFFAVVAVSNVVAVIVKAMIFARSRQLGKFYCQCNTNQYGTFQLVIWQRRSEA